MQLNSCLDLSICQQHFDKGYEIEQWIKQTNQIHGHFYEDLVSAVTWSFSLRAVFAWGGVGASDEDVDRFDDDDAFICRIFIFEDCIPEEREKEKETNKQRNKHINNDNYLR